MSAGKKARRDGRKKRKGVKASAKPTAHQLVRPAVEAQVERIEEAARRVGEQLDDGEAIHDFRVAMRRLRTILRAARALYSKKQLAPMEAALRRHGDATGALRDAEVLAETLEAAGVEVATGSELAGWLARRQREADRMREDVIALLSLNELDATYAQLRDLMSREPRDQSAKRFAKDQLAAVRRGVKELLPVRHHEVERLHRLRVRFKRLRYTAEMLERFMAVADKDHPRVDYGAIVNEAQRFQKRLGLLHDADVAVALFEDPEQLAGLSPDTRETTREALVALRQRLVDESLEALERGGYHARPGGGGPREKG
ncbi:MAG: CHAD domain-containing protein [Myxococcales bacterium]|nr:CHAD domain-containing protein [Myxococcales bacterium]